MRFLAPGLILAILFTGCGDSSNNDKNDKKYLTIYDGSDTAPENIPRSAMLWVAQEGRYGIASKTYYIKSLVRRRVVIEDLGTNKKENTCPEKQLSYEVKLTPINELGEDQVTSKPKLNSKQSDGEAIEILPNFEYRFTLDVNIPSSCQWGSAGVYVREVSKFIPVVSADEESFKAEVLELREGSMVKSYYLENTESVKTELEVRTSGDLPEGCSNEKFENEFKFISKGESEARSVIKKPKMGSKDPEPITFDPGEYDFTWEIKAPAECQGAKVEFQLKAK